MKADENVSVFLVILSALCVLILILTFVIGREVAKIDGRVVAIENHLGVGIPPTPVGGTAVPTLAPRR